MKKLEYRTNVNPTTGFFQNTTITIKNKKIHSITSESPQGTGYLYKDTWEKDVATVLLSIMLDHKESILDDVNELCEY